MSAEEPISPEDPVSIDDPTGPDDPTSADDPAKPDGPMSADEMAANLRGPHAGIAEDSAERMRQRIQRNVERYQGADPRDIDLRIRRLEHAWDVERTLQANAAGISLLGLVLGRFVDRRWFLLPAAAAAVLAQQAVQGWSPPVPLLRRLGMRTRTEISEEITALRILRGDFKPTEQASEAVAQAERIH